MAYMKGTSCHTVSAMSFCSVVSVGMALKMRVVDKRRRSIGLGACLVRKDRHDDWRCLGEQRRQSCCALATVCRTPILDRSMVDVKIAYRPLRNWVILPVNGTHRSEGGDMHIAA